MGLSDALYRQVALADPQGHWELVDGRLRGKPGGTFLHNYVASNLITDLVLLVEGSQGAVRTNAPRLRVQTPPRSPYSSFFLPDVCVVPRKSVERRLRENPEQLEEYDEPMLFVAEVWWDPTDDYDVDRKLFEYRRRGDLEVWRVHPHEEAVTRWIRLENDAYAESVLRSGSVQLSALPNVEIEIESLFGHNAGDDDGDQ